jgi:DNA repair exonuclease SbcCD nuclease subunit
MTAFRFVHTSDLHLGRRFAGLPEEVRARLAPARHGILARLAEVARARDAAHILVAGDLFDVETPDPRVWRQALDAMGAESGQTWWLLPGNHDSLAAEPLWDGIRGRAPANVQVLDSPTPREIAPGVWLLPSPIAHRFTGMDATAWMAGCATPDGALRIGLAHGGVTSFGSEQDSADLIPPDLPALARLDYLALGDWHGALRIGPRCWFSGSPERDRFKHPGRGVCLAVTLAAPGAVPDVTEVPVGEFDWAQAELDLTPGLDPVAELARVLPEAGTARRDILLRLRLSGRVRLPDRARLDRAIEAERPLFWHMEVDDAGLANDVSPDDMDAIAESGALRLAADTLLAEAGDAARSAAERAVAQAALDRLYALTREAGA